MLASIALAALVDDGDGEGVFVADGLAEGVGEVEAAGDFTGDALAAGGVGEVGFGETVGVGDGESAEAGAATSARTELQRTSVTTARVNTAGSVWEPRLHSREEAYSPLGRNTASLLLARPERGR